MVATQFDEKHSTVAVKRDLPRILDKGIRQDWFESVPRRQPELLRLF
jgi:hypothetical protein